MLKGVNLGGWLVLERWIKPSLFEDISAEDETSFCLELGGQKTEKLNHHRETFITETDFKWLAGRGIDAVRIPIPHWLFGDIEPYVGGIEFLDRAMGWADKHNLKVLLDIHTAPGSQNGWDHSGQKGQIRWHKDKANIQASLDFLIKIAIRYAHHPSLWGIEVLNEPASTIPKRTLKNFYRAAYESVRQHCGKQVVLVISDSFKPKKWQSELAGKEHENVMTDVHLFQTFKFLDKRQDLKQLIKRTNKWEELIGSMQRYKPVIVGEWSLGIGSRRLRQLAPKEADYVRRAYAEAQLKAFRLSSGWFFFTYKMTDKGGWNFRHCVETGLLPERF